MTYQTCWLIGSSPTFQQCIVTYQTCSTATFHQMSLPGVGWGEGYITQLQCHSDPKSNFQTFNLRGGAEYIAQLQCQSDSKSNFQFRGGCGYSEHHPNPNLKSSSKCHCMSRSNFSFLGAVGEGDILSITLILKVIPNVTTCLYPIFHFWVQWGGGGILNMTLTLKVVPNVALSIEPTFHFWEWWRGILSITITLKVVPNVATCLDPTFHFWVQQAGGGYSENHPNPNPKSCSKCHYVP